VAALRKALGAVGGLAAFTTDDKAIVKLTVNNEGETIDYRVWYYPSPDMKPVGFRIEGGFQVLPSSKTSRLGHNSLVGEINEERRPRGIYPIAYQQ